MRKARITATRSADDDHNVLTVEGGNRSTYRRRPCGGCPWRVDQVGQFPAEAFRISATTAYDMASNTFACHESGTEKPALCAGGILGEHHNLGLRLAMIRGDLDPRDVSDGGVDLFETYRDMAEANGVDPDDPVLRGCR